MSEKVILTEAQNRVIEKALINRKGDRAQLLDDHAKMRGSWIADYRVLDELTVLDMARVIYDGEYEVEHPKFKAGDKVTWDGLNEVLVVKDVYQVGGTWSCSFEDAAGCATAKSFRYATPDEIYWLHDLKRDKAPDFRKGDVLMDERETLFTIGREIDADIAEEWIDDSNFIGIYPAESFKPLKKEQPK